MQPKNGRTSRAPHSVGGFSFRVKASSLSSENLCRLCVSLSGRCFFRLLVWAWSSSCQDCCFEEQQHLTLRYAPSGVATLRSVSSSSTSFSALLLRPHLRSYVLCALRAPIRAMLISRYALHECLSYFELFLLALWYFFSIFSKASLSHAGVLLHPLNICFGVSLPKNLPPLSPP